MDGDACHLLLIVVSRKWRVSVYLGSLRLPCFRWVGAFSGVGNASEMATDKLDWLLRFQSAQLYRARQNRCCQKEPSNRITQHVDDEAKNDRPK